MIVILHLQTNQRNYLFITSGLKKIFCRPVSLCDTVGYFGTSLKGVRLLTSCNILPSVYFFHHAFLLQHDSSPQMEKNNLREYVTDISFCFLSYFFVLSIPKF